MSGIERRLARLEQAVSPRETVHVWEGEEPLADSHRAAIPRGGAEWRDGDPLIVGRTRIRLRQIADGGRDERAIRSQAGRAGASFGRWRY